MTIRRFSLCLMVVISLSAAITAVLFWKLTSVIAELSDIRDEQYISSQLAQEISTTSRALTANVRAYAVTGDVIYERVYNELVAITNGTVPRPIAASIAPGKTIPRATLLSAHGLTPAELGKLTESANLSQNLVELEVEAMHMVKGIFKDDQGKYTVKKTLDRERAIQLVFGSAYNDSTVRIMQPHDDFYEMMETRITAEVARIEATVQMFTWLAAGAIATMLALSLTMAVYMYKGISLKLAATARFAESVAQGNLDLTSPVESGNEIGVLRASLNTMTIALRTRILEATESLQQATIKEQEAREAMLSTDAASKVAENKNQSLLLAADKLEVVASIVSSAVVQLNAQLGESENNASLQAARITETATAMEEMNSTVLEVARNASEAAKVSAQTRLRAETGAQEVSQVIVSVQRTQQEALALKGNMCELETRAQDISQIMSVISDIADQTNLLALNAAIEAARAGEAGRGFAVVADEVRKLAEKTMISTIDVGNAIKSIQESTTQSAQQVDKAVSSIAAVTGDIQLAGDSLQEIVALVDATADQVRGIAAASEEQSATSDEINRALLDVNSLAGNTVSAMKESTQAINALSHQAQGLSQLIDDMKKS